MPPLPLGKLSELSRRDLLLLLAATATTACSDSLPTYDSLPPDTLAHLAIFGDSRDNNDVFARLAARTLHGKGPDHVIHLGDMISDAAHSEQWPAFVRLVATMFPDRPFYPVVGNHDVDDNASLAMLRGAYPAVPPLGYYTATHNGIYLAVLNTEDLDAGHATISPTQLAWLTTQLTSSEATAATARCICMHRPLFPQNHHADMPVNPQDTLHQLFRTHRVTAVFAGHEHSYSRTSRDGVTYIISGGAGSHLYQAAGRDAAFYHYLQVAVLPTNLRIRAIDINGTIRDDFQLALL